MKHNGINYIFRLSVEQKIFLLDKMNELVGATRKTDVNDCTFDELIAILDNEMQDAFDQGFETGAGISKNPQNLSSHAKCECGHYSYSNPCPTCGKKYLKEKGVR